MVYMCVFHLLNVECKATLSLWKALVCYRVKVSYGYFYQTRAFANPCSSSDSKCQYQVK